MNPLQLLRRRWAVLSEAVSARLWPVPVLSIIVAVALGVGLTRLDDRLDDNLPSQLTDYLFSGSPDAARSVLSTIAGSLTTVTSLTFSLTVVTLQLASSQFSPRLLRTFTRDRFVQNTLGVFLSTFAFALTVLRTVRGSANGSRLVPQISVTVAFVLAVASAVTLVLFLAHLVREIRVETLLKTVHADASSTLSVMRPERCRDSTAPSGPEVPAHAVTLLAATSGFLTAVDNDDLLEAAAEDDVVIYVHRPIGSSLVAGTPVAQAWGRSGPLSMDAETQDRVQRCLDKSLLVGAERTSPQDITYGLRQLADVANKALSPGINDPTTAVHTLGHCSAFLCEAARHELGPELLHDEDGTVRVVVAGTLLAEMLELAIGQPRRYGAADPDVLARIFVLLREVGWIVRADEEVEAVRKQLARLRRTAEAQDFDETEQARLDQLGTDVEEALHGRWLAS